MNYEALEHASGAVTASRGNRQLLVATLRFTTGLDAEERGLVVHLVDEGQFWPLLHLKRAEYSVRLALDALTPDTEYLREDLVQQLNSLGLLLEKMEHEEHLRRDRDALLSAVRDSPDQGVTTWISGNSTE